MILLVRLARRGVAILVIAAACWIAGLELGTWRQAQRLRAQLADGPFTEELADRAAEVAESSPFGIGSRGLAEVAGERVLAEADRQFEALQTSLTSPDDNHPAGEEYAWRALDRLYSRALALGAPRERIALRRHLAQGEAARLAAKHLFEEGHRSEGHAALRRAEGALRRAARIAPNAPEPFLGLARVYALDTGGQPIFSTVSLADAQRSAERLGYVPNGPERLWVPDRHIAKGRSLRQQALLRRGKPDEQSLLVRAADELLTGLAAYRDLNDPGTTATRAQRSAERELDTLLNRLSFLDPEAWESIRRRRYAP